MNNINLKTIKPQFMAQIIRALRGDKAIKQTVFDLRARFNVLNRPFDKADFYKICQSENIFVFDDVKESYAVRGIYISLIDKLGKKWRSICISPYLSKRSCLKIAFHELGHHFLHGHKPIEHFSREPQTLNYYVREAQANFFSDLMLSEVKIDEQN